MENTQHNQTEQQTQRQNTQRRYESQQQQEQTRTQQELLTLQAVSAFCGVAPTILIDLFVGRPGVIDDGWDSGKEHTDNYRLLRIPRAALSACLMEAQSGSMGSGAAVGA
jgi:hypothetical protein